MRRSGIVEPFPICLSHPPCGVREGRGEDPGHGTYSNDCQRRGCIQLPLGRPKTQARLIHLSGHFLPRCRTNKRNSGDICEVNSHLIPETKAGRGSVTYSRSCMAGKYQRWFWNYSFLTLNPEFWKISFFGSISQTYLFLPLHPHGPNSF